MLAIDLGVPHRDSHTASVQEAGAWTAVWVALAYRPGGGQTITSITGYVIEHAPSVDNPFAFVLIFSHYAAPAAYQHRVLLRGLLGLRSPCLILRGAVDRFHFCKVASRRCPSSSAASSLCQS